MEKVFRSPFWLLFLLASFSLRVLPAEEILARDTSTTSNSSELSSTESLPTLDDLLTMLSDEASAQYEDSKRLLEQLTASQTEAEGLSFSLTQLKLQYESLGSAVEAERDAARNKIQEEQRARLKAEASQKRWMVAGIAGIGAATIELLAIAILIALN